MAVRLSSGRVCARPLGGRGGGDRGGRDAGRGVGVASLMMRGFGDPRTWFRAAGVRCLGASVAPGGGRVLLIAESRVPAADGPASRSPDRWLVGGGYSAVAAAQRKQDSSRAQATTVTLC